MQVMDSSPEMMTPVQEVELYLLQENVKNQIFQRARNRLNSCAQTYRTPEPKKRTIKKSPSRKRKAAEPDVIVVSDYSSDEEVEASSGASAVTATHAHVLPRAMKHEPPSLQQLRVPKTIRMEWMRVERLFHDGETDAPKCTCPTCPYSAGGPLQNRYNLIERLVELEHYLWGPSASTTM